MGSLEQFKIDLKGLKEPTTTFSFSLDNEFFEVIQATEVKGGSLDATLVVGKLSSIYELDFHIAGEVVVTCDLCLDDLRLPVETCQKVVVRLDQEDGDDEDSILVAEEEGVADVAWLIYEFIALSLPTRHVHPEGMCNPDMVQRLQEMTAHVQNDEASVDTTDPRWSKLKDLKSTINK